MQNSKLIHYLSQFSAQDLTKFSDFVASPYFNKHQKTRELLALILKTKNWQGNALQKEKVFQKLFPKQVYEEQLLSNISSYLLRLVRRFLAQQQSEKKEVEQQLNLLENAFQSGQKKLFELTKNRLQRRFEHTSTQDSFFHFQQSRYQRLLDDFSLQYGDRTDGDFLEQALVHFDTYFIGEKLKMTCQMLARKQVVGRTYSLSLIDEIARFLDREQARFKNIPSVWMYYLIYKMMTQDDPKHYFNLKEKLKVVYPFFEHQEGRDLHTAALNYCIQRLNFGEENYRQETFEIYQQMLDNGLLYVDGKLPQWDYTNIVSLGCHLQEYDWTKAFIFEQKEQLKSNEKENTFTYNLAAFEHHQKHYEAAIDLLQKIEFTDVYYSLLARILQMKIYFESQQWQALDSTLETFRIYLLRNKNMTEQRRKSGLNLLRFTKRLMRLHEEKETINSSTFSTKMEALKTQIIAKEMVLNKAWLLEQME